MTRKADEEYRFWARLCAIGTQMTTAASTGDRGRRARLERQYAETLTQLRRLRAAG